MSRVGKRKKKIKMVVSVANVHKFYGLVAQYEIPKSNGTYVCLNIFNALISNSSFDIEINFPFRSPIERLEDSIVRS